MMAIDFRCQDCDGSGGINCNCIIVWNARLSCWFPVQQTEVWFNRLSKLDVLNGASNDGHRWTSLSNIDNIRWNKMGS